MSKHTPPVSTSPQNSDQFIVYDETFEGELGKVRILVEVPRTKSRAELYFSALKESRGIPFDLENINPLDKMYQYVYQNIPTLRGKGNEDAAKAKVQYFYQQQQTDAYRDAVMLAIIADKTNVFDFEPELISDEEFGNEDDLPGMVNTPKPERNLQNPTEHRLAQFYTLLKKNTELVYQFTKAFEKATISINELAVAQNVTPEGFQSKSAS